MRPRRCAQVGLDADGFERVVVRERRTELRLGRASRMDEREIAADRRRKTLIDAAGDEFGLPQRKILGRQIVHREHARLRVLAEHLGHGLGQPRVHRAHPRRLGGVALDGRLPQRRDLEARGARA